MRQSQGSLLFRGVRGFFRRLVFGFFDVQIEGLERLPAAGGAVIAANHPSLLDGVLLLAISPRPVRFLVAEDMYTHRFLNPFFKALGCIPVYRTKTHNGDALRAAVAALDAGDVIGIFPEGTTYYRGSLREIKRGVALLALKTGRPVIPLAFRGCDEAFPEGARVPRPGQLQVRFGEPAAYPKTDSDPIPAEQVAGTLEQIRCRMAEVLETTPATSRRPLAPTWLKELEIALCALVVLPLVSFLTTTANPSLDPVKKAHA